MAVKTTAITPATEAELIGDLDIEDKVEYSFLLANYMRLFGLLLNYFDGDRATAALDFSAGSDWN